MTDQSFTAQSGRLCDSINPAMGAVLALVGPTDPGDLAIVRRKPLGVVDAVVPLNLPLDMVMRKTAADMAAFCISFNQDAVHFANSKPYVERPIQDPLVPASKMGAIVDARQTAGSKRYVKARKASDSMATGGTKEHIGPVKAVIPFDTEDEGASMVTAAIYGLAASVWTDNLSWARRAADRLNVDTVSAQRPFDGVTQSGFGCSISAHSLDKFAA